MSRIGTPSRPKWAHDAIGIAARIARREWLLDPGATWDEYNRVDDSMGDAAHNLTQAINAGCVEVADAGRRIARLERILAVERGDASAAPEGWRRSGNTWSTYDNFYAHRADAGRWEWVSRRGKVIFSRGTAPTALEAMEAADMAAETGGRGL